MFNDKEIEEYDSLFNDIKITDKNEQRQILTFLYTLGTIIYNNNFNLDNIDYDEEKEK